MLKVIDGEEWGIAEHGPSALWYTTRTVAYNIPEILSSRKVQDGLLITAVVLLGAISFGLGRLSAVDTKTSEVALCDALESQTATALSALPSTDTGTSLNLGAKKEQPAMTGKGAYVASKSGSAYHFPWCSGAQRIKEENKIWFQTKEEAEQAGYRPASNCKGL